MMSLGSLRGGTPLRVAAPTTSRPARGPATLSVVAKREDGSLGVVITGSTKGIGLALSKKFISEGDRVCITSRTAADVDRVVGELTEQYGEGVVFGVPCDMSNPGDVTGLATFARDNLTDGVDLWINNAGTNGYVYDNLVDTEPETLKEVVDTNVLGTLFGCREAIKLMAAQPTGGHVFCMEGAGSDGNKTVKYAAYGMSKAGMAQLAKSLAAEAKGTGVGIHTLSPGLVYTELVAAGRYAFGRSGRFFVNTIGEDPNNVAEDIVPQLRDFGDKVGGNSRVAYLTPTKALKKFYGRLANGEGKDRWIPEDDPDDPELAKQEEGEGGGAAVAAAKRLIGKLTSKSSDEK